MAATRRHANDAPARSQPNCGRRRVGSAGEQSKLRLPLARRPTQQTGKLANWQTGKLANSPKRERRNPNAGRGKAGSQIEFHIFPASCQLNGTNRIKVAATQWLLARSLGRQCRSLAAADANLLALILSHRLRRPAS